MPVRRQPGNIIHFRFVQNQQHKDVIGNAPFALDSLLASGSESESRIVVRVTYDNNKWTTCILEFPVPHVDQFTSNSLALAFWKYCHGTQCPASKVATDSYRGVHDVTYDLVAHCRHQGKQSASIGSQCVWTYDRGGKDSTLDVAKAIAEYAS
jgi:hypothetical protein